MANSQNQSTNPMPILPQNVPVTNPDNIRAVYSNFFGVNATVTDFTIIFLEVGFSPEKSGPKNEVKAMVTLPIAAIAGLQEVLQQLSGQSETAKLAAQEAALSVHKE